MASQIFYMACPPDSLPKWLCRYWGTGVVFTTPGWKGRVFSTVDCGVMDLVHLVGSCPADTCGSILWLRYNTECPESPYVCQFGIICMLSSILRTDFNFLHVFLNLFFNVDGQEPLEQSLSTGLSQGLAATLSSGLFLTDLASLWFLRGQRHF